MMFQARTTQLEDEFGSQESILIYGGVKTGPPELFDYCPEWLKFFLISMFCSPGSVENNSQSDNNLSIIIYKYKLHCIERHFH